MREIKFRAWDLSNKAMYSHEELTDGSVVNPDVLIDCLVKPGNGYDTDTELMQYTGLHDKNGKEIYEGDVLGGLYGLVVRWCDKCKSIELFELGEDEYCYQCNGDLFWYDVAVDDNLEVIGNIHENPELLEANQ